VLKIESVTTRPTRGGVDGYSGLLKSRSVRFTPTHSPLARRKTSQPSSYSGLRKWAVAECRNAGTHSGVL